MKPEQAVKHEECGYFDSDVDQAIGRESFYSFSRSSEWIQLLNVLGQHENNKLSKGPSIENGEGARPLDYCNGITPLAYEKNGVKETINSMKPNSGLAKLKNNAIGDMQSHKTADAKANGETEKYLAGWPLLSPSKISLQKCKKCSQEFCSTVNYRRHIRIHRRSLNIDKVCPKTREFLCSFWDELPLDEKKEILSFSNVSLEEVAGISIMRTLTSLILRPGFSSLPQIYAKAGPTLSDIIQANPSICPPSSQELFSVLDDASERTFLCAGSAVSLQKFVFDREVGKVALDVKNVTACASFLLEQKLVKAWLALKDAEALRCQKLLMEEEEAAQKRQAELLERKRLKKLRLREHRAKEHSDGNKADEKGDASDVVEALSCCGESPSSGPLSEHELSTPEASFGSSTESLASNESSGNQAEAVVTPEIEPEDGYLFTDHSQPESDQQQAVASRHLVPRTTKALGSFQAIQSSSTKSMVMKRSFKDSKNTSSVNCQMVWTRKTKSETDPILSNRDKVEEEIRDRADETDNSVVLIGSITVRLEKCNMESVGQNNLPDRSVKLDSFLNNETRPTVKLWRPVSRQGTMDSSTFLSSKKQVELDGSLNEAVTHIPSEQNLPNHDGIGIDRSVTKNLKMVLGSAPYSSPQLFSTEVAEAFLAKRWKDALATDHVEFVSSQTSETDACSNDSNSTEELLPSSDYSGRSILGNAENRMAAVGQFDSAHNSFYKPKFKGKPDKNYRVKYIPKQRIDVLER